MDASADNRTVSLTVPSDPDYLVLARLALSGVCRLTSLSPEDVVDLKLAVTEAAAGALSGGESGVGTETIGFRYCLEDDRLILDITGSTRPVVSAEERELGRAILEATVDESIQQDGGIRLVKRLPADDGV